MVQANKTLHDLLSQIDIHDYFNVESMPWRPGESILSHTPEYEDFIVFQWFHEDFDSEWMQHGLYAQGYYDVMSDVPTLHMSSWYDPYSRTATDNYKGQHLAKQKPVRLVMGPWMHGGRSRQISGDVDFGEQATLDGNLGEDWKNFRLEWFDEHMKDDSIFTRAGVMPPVQIFVMGGGSGEKTAAGHLLHGGKWRVEERWPLLDTVDTPFYFTRDGMLSAQPEPAEGTNVFVYDPSDPVPSIGGTITSGKPIMEGGGFDQKESSRFFPSQPPYLRLSQRDDIISFVTEPLQEDLELTGPVLARLWVSSNCTDTDFTVKVIDMYPPSRDYPEGYDLNLHEGILRMRFRNNSWAAPSPMTPGERYQIEVETYPVSNLFVRGHRIRVDISSSNFPHFDLNPNTYDDLRGPGGATGFNIAENTVFVGGSAASHVVLPVINHAATRTTPFRAWIQGLMV